MPKVIEIYELSIMDPDFTLRMILKNTDILQGTFDPEKNEFVSHMHNPKKYKKTPT